MRNTALSQLPGFYLPAIDGLRGIAILMVLFNHSTQLFDLPHYQERALWRMTPGAFMGVDLFFVVSGYLITSILLRAQEKPGAFRVFWLRRALRIFPLAYLYLAALACLAYFTRFFPNLRHPEWFAWVGGYGVNFYVASHGWIAPAMSILWSLAVEEQFYTLWPAVALYASRKTLVRVLGAVILLTPVARALSSHYLGSSAAYVLTFCRWDSLAVGAALAMLWSSEWQAQTSLWCKRLLWPSLIPPLVVLLFPLGPEHAVHSELFDTIGYSFLGWAFFVWTANALEPSPRLARLLTLRPLTYMGKLCYGLYIWHVVSADATQLIAGKLHAHWSFYVQVAVWLCVLFAVATASFRLFESPLLRLKDRIH